MSKADQKKTFTLAVKHVIASLDRVAGDDENLEVLNDTFATAKFPIDTSALDAEALMADPKVQRAFKKFISDTIGSFQYQEETGEDY